MDATERLADWNSGDEVRNYTPDSLLFQTDLTNVLLSHAALLAERDTLRAALKPLAKVADLVGIGGNIGDDMGLWIRQSTIPGADYTLTVGDARRARAALAPKEPK